VWVKGYHAGEEVGWAERDVCADEESRGNLLHIFRDDILVFVFFGVDFVFDFDQNWLLGDGD
jgi:hypothetical protein